MIDTFTVSWKLVTGPLWHHCWVQLEGGSMNGLLRYCYRKLLQQPCICIQLEFFTVRPGGMRVFLV